MTRMNYTNADVLYVLCSRVMACMENSIVNLSPEARIQVEMMIDAELACMPERDHRAALMWTLADLMETVAAPRKR